MIKQFIWQEVPGNTHIFYVGHVGVSHGYTDYHQGRAIHMADSRID